MRSALAMGGVFCVAGLCLAGVGCGGGSSGAGGASSSTGAGQGGSGGGDQIACTGQPSSVDLGGVWAARGVLNITLQGKPGGAITTCPADQIGESDLLLLLDMQPDANDPTKLSSVKATLCSIKLPTVTALVGQCPAHPDNLVSTTLDAPQAFLDALPAIATQPVTGQLSGDKPGADLSLDRFTVTVGSTKPGSAMPKWNTGDPACNDMTLGHQTVCESMCVDDCGSLRDDDKDGYPGVTLEVCGYTPMDMSSNVKCNAENPDVPGATVQGKAFLDIQVDPQFTGQAVSSCEITGKVDTSVLYNLVGADVYLAGSPISVTSAIDSLPDFKVLADQSKFRMVRIDGMYGTEDWKANPADPGAACKVVIAKQNEL